MFHLAKGTFGQTGQNMNGWDETCAQPQGRVTVTRHLIAELTLRD